MGSLCDYAVSYLSSIALEDALKLLPYAAQAPFSSFETQHNPFCLPKTRVELLRDIMTWADGLNEKCIFWLRGLAGTGKSTIARTVAQRYYDQNRLGASFFFSRGGGDVSNARMFFTSIAIQLARKSLPLKPHICEAIIEHGDIARQSLRDQWRQLVFRPLSKLDAGSSFSTFILVVDALDECDNESDIQEIVRLLAEARSLRKVQLRIFITSRPETPIRCSFDRIPSSEHQDFVLHDIKPAIVDHDIAIFLEHEFTVIAQEFVLAPGWPGEQVIRRLAQIASGLFIWVATACRFIREGLFAEGRLRILLEGSGFSTTPEEHLNEIYITVLQNSIRPVYTVQEKQMLYSMLKRILGSIVTLFSPLSTDSLSKLLHIPKQKLCRALNDLYAILDIPKNLSRPIRLHHPSFRDFLLDKERCRDLNFWADKKQVHHTLAANCIRLMSLCLKQNIYSINDPGALVSDVDSSQVQQYLPSEVQYVCLYWVQHLQRSGTQLYDDNQVHRFLREHLLHWLEALSWMGKTSEGILAILSLEAQIPVSLRLFGVY